MGTTALPFSPEDVFEDLVGWCADMAVETECPGLLVGISGTDSILALAVCAAAFERIGMPERVSAVHFGRDFDPDDPRAERSARLSPAYRFVPRIVFPWLRCRFPKVSLSVVGDFDYRDDRARWARLHTMSLADTLPTEELRKESSRWVVGTRNATEEALGTYSNISSSVSVQPIINLWKGEVLRMCSWLGAPGEAISMSRQADCDCGRHDLAAENIDFVDLILKARLGKAESDAPGRQIPHALLRELEDYVDRQIAEGGYKRLIPYRPTVAA